MFSEIAALLLPFFHESNSKTIAGKAVREQDSGQGAREVCSAAEQVCTQRPPSAGGRGAGLSPAALFTGHGPLRVVLTVAEVRHEVVKPDNSTTAKHSVVTGNL